MNLVHIEPHYLPPIEFFVVMDQSDKVFWDIERSFEKQTYRNRAMILGPNGKQALSIPVHSKSKTPLKDVKIDYQQSWLRDHWGAIYSSYGKAPFYEHFADMFKGVMDKKPKFLFELNMEMLSVCQYILNTDIPVELRNPNGQIIDLREVISAKKAFQSREIMTPIDYQQNFGSTFVPNLSILDLLFCQGPDANVIIKRSAKKPIERIQL